MPCRNKLGIKSSLSERECHALQALARDKRVIEVGSLLGYSTIQMARVAERVFAIDPHEGYPFYNATPTLQEFLHNIERWGVAGAVTPIIAKAQQVLANIIGCDLAFIDTSGTYADTMYCLKAAKVPVLAVHDFGRSGCGGASEAVMDYVRWMGKNLRVVDTLAIIE